MCAPGVSDYIVVLVLEVQKAGHCAWTGWLNNWDDELHYKCPLSGYIAGFYSYHDNTKEDRRWRWFCCMVRMIQPLYSYTFYIEKYISSL